MKTRAEATKAAETVLVNSFTNGILDPQAPMLGPLRSGGHIVANTSPACWGPMITPAIRGGHEVNQPVMVDGAEVGDAVLIRIEEITVTSLAAASGVHRVVEGRNAGDPSILAKCPGCGTVWPETRIEGTGEDAIRCAHCGAEASPFKVVHGYTVVFDAERQLGVTVSSQVAAGIAKDAYRYAALPEKSIVNPFLAVAPSHLSYVATRLRPFMGNLGTMPSVKISANSNAGDAIRRVLNASHDYAVDETALAHLTDGHMDCDSVRAGAILLCPVKVQGAGIYMGDMHAMQGDGEIAGHTVDVSGTVRLEVELVKGLNIDGPILFPVPEDLPFLARPLSAEERRNARVLAKEWGLPTIELSAPISFIGTGFTLNKAADNGLERAAKLLDMTVEEVRNRATITGSIEIARAAGVVQVTFLAPLSRLDAVGVGKYAREQYRGMEEE
jgi:formamidase